MPNIILLGAPGSGKGTQAIQLAQKLQVPAISTGDALRKEVENLSEIGKMAKSYMDSGKLVPDDVVLEIVKVRISQNDCKNGLILDGFPRNVNQAIMLENALKTIKQDINLVLNFEIDDEIVVKRISGRFFCKKCGAIYNKYFKAPRVEGVCDECGSAEFTTRSDDKEEIIRDRLKIYHDTVSKLIEFYQKKDLIFSFNAVKSSALLLKELLEIIKKY